MRSIKTDIIPNKQAFAKLDVKHEINYEAICVFVALGFFLDQDCYFKDEVCLRPGTINTIDDNGILIDSKPWFNWHYSPNNKSYKTTLSEFSTLFEDIIKKQVEDNTVILPLSGGLDSRTQAVALHKLNNKVNAYSYQFKNGYKEAKISKDIARACDFAFQEYTINKSYLWNRIEELAELNKCYAEFTHPRQMAIINQLKKYEGVFSLGHWGDVLFDGYKDQNLSSEKVLDVVMMKIVKPGGMELATELWDHWKLDGTFISYLEKRVENLLNEIQIDNSSAKIRAFKSLYWAPRWTSANLSVFEAAAPITLPYYANEMCEFICTVPENYLFNRQLQIDYIKTNSLELSKITWHQNRPFNLLSYKYNKAPYNLPYRIISKLKRTLANLTGNTFIQRNWELQFLGSKNESKLLSYLSNEAFEGFVPKRITEQFYTRFKEDNTIKYSHSVSMLLTLALWQLNCNEDRQA